MAANFNVDPRVGFGVAAPLRHLPADGRCGESRLGVDPDPEIGEWEPGRGVADHCVFPPETDGDTGRARGLEGPGGDVIENTIKFGFVPHRLLSGPGKRQMILQISSEARVTELGWRKYVIGSECSKVDFKLL